MDSSKIIHKFEPLWDSWKSDELIGYGSISKVYKISRREFGKEYTSALKLITIPSDKQLLKLTKLNINKSKEDSLKYVHTIVKKAINEVKLLYELKGHSNIISYEDHMIKKIANDKWLIFIRMELAKALNVYIFENKFTINKTIQLGIDICSALETCHSKNIIHRDIKESNIFVSNNGTFKLGDFSVSKETTNPNFAKTKVGTLNYIPPEVFTGSRYNNTSDIYSLGIVLYKLLNNGKFPINDNSPNKNEDYFERLSSAKFLPPINSFPELSNIILKACSFDPGNRHQSAEEFKSELLKLSKPNTSIPNLLNSAIPENTITSERAITEFVERRKTGVSQTNTSLARTEDVQTLIKEVEKKSKSNLLLIFLIIILSIVLIVSMLHFIFLLPKSNENSNNSDNNSYNYNSTSTYKL